jgi:hypothetical protein
MPYVVDRKKSGVAYIDRGTKPQTVKPVKMPAPVKIPPPVAPKGK